MWIPFIVFFGFFSVSVIVSVVFSIKARKNIKSTFNNFGDNKDNSSQESGSIFANLENIIKNKFNDKMQNEDEKSSTCEYCGCKVKKEDGKCPSCGAVNKNND